MAHSVGFPNTHNFQLNSFSIWQICRVLSISNSRKTTYKQEIWNHAYYWEINYLDWTYISKTGVGHPLFYLPTIPKTTIKAFRKCKTKIVDYNIYSQHHLTQQYVFVHWNSLIFFFTLRFPKRGFAHASGAPSSHFPYVMWTDIVLDERSSKGIFRLVWLSPERTWRSSKKVPFAV